MGKRFLSLGLALLLVWVATMIGTTIGIVVNRKANSYDPPPGREIRRPTRNIAIESKEDGSEKKRGSSYAYALLGSEPKEPPTYKHSERIDERSNLQFTVLDGEIERLYYPSQVDFYSNGVVDVIENSMEGSTGFRVKGNWICRRIDRPKAKENK